jgi:L-asparaginase
VRPRVLVVSCGGTISSRASRPGGPASPAASAADLVAAVPGLAQLADLTTVVHSLVPSSFATLADVLGLLERIRDLVAQAAADGAPFDGVVVTHGTDTLEEVAFALDLFWPGDLSLAITGAMRNSSVAGADGPANLLAAVATVVDGAARSLGVLVVLNDVIHAARLVRKTHTSNVATFESPSVGPLGFVAEGRATIALVPRSRVTLPTPPSAVDAGAIRLVTAGIGDDARALAGTSTALGVVLESMGGGHLPPALVESPEFATLLRRCPVVVASRTGAGPGLSATYDFRGSEIWLRDHGAIFSGILDGLKSRVLLAVLVALGHDRPTIAASFAEIGLDQARHPASGPAS